MNDDIDKWLDSPPNWQDVTDAKKRAYETMTQQERLRRLMQSRAATYINVNPSYPPQGTPKQKKKKNKKRDLLASGLVTLAPSDDVIDYIMQMQVVEKDPWDD